MRSTSEVRRNSSHRPLRRMTSQDATDHTEPKRKWKLWPVPEIFQFAIVSGLAGALVNAIYTFFPSIMTTIEKRFNINNQRLSYILMANDISGILIGPFSTYYMAKKNIPKSLSFVLILMMIYSFIIASPHLLYGSGELALSFVEGNVTESLIFSSSINQSTSAGVYSKLCNASQVPLLSTDEASGGLPTSLPPPDSNIWVIVIFFTGHFISGIATSIFWSLLLTYLDNNVSKAKAPLIHSLNMMIRFLGILLGNAMNNLGLQFYINPFLTPTIDYTDPRWIGAWWFTPAVLGFLFIIPAVLISRFPVQMRREDNYNLEDVEGVKSFPLIEKDGTGLEIDEDVEVPADKPSLSDMWISVKRLLRNKIVIYTMLSFVARRLGHLPFNTYMVKYMELLYNIPAADANGYIAKYDTPSLIVGVALSGLVTTKLRPSARQLQAFSMFVSLLLAVSTAGYIFYGCGTEEATVSSNTCALTCSCEDIKFTPICGSDQVTYNSPCEAGCGSFDEYTKRYDDCACIPKGIYSNRNGTFGGFAQDGPCKLEMCKYPFYFFLATQGATNFLAACTWTTATIIALRSVETRDKAFCLSLYEIVGSLFVSIPGPLILSAILDSLCIRRDVPSNPNTVCWQYDRKWFSYAFNGSSSLLVLVSIFFSGMVWRHLKDVEIFEKKLKKVETAHESI